MSIIRLTEAPLKIPFANSDNLTLADIWLQYMGDLADSTSGYWGRQDETLIVTGVTTGDDLENIFVIQSNTVSISLNFNGLTSVDATVEIPEEYEVINGFVTMVQVESSGLINVINQLYVEDSTFKIPDLTVSDTVIISGSLIRRS